MRFPRRVAALACLVVLGGIARAHGQTQSAAAAAISKSTPHLSFTATLTPAVIAPGAQLQLAIDVVPKKGMHVYAPGGDNRPVVVKVTPHASLQLHDTVYPKPSVYKFTPTNDEWLVFDAPFRLSQNITVRDAAALKTELGTSTKLTLKTELQYQACDDAVCYLPMSVPFEWSLAVRR